VVAVVFRKHTLIGGKFTKYSIDLCTYDSGFKKRLCQMPKIIRRLTANIQVSDANFHIIILKVRNKPFKRTTKLKMTTLDTVNLVMAKCLNSKFKYKAEITNIEYYINDYTENDMRKPEGHYKLWADMDDNYNTTVGNIYNYDYSGDYIYSDGDYSDIEDNKDNPLGMEDISSSAISTIDILDPTNPTDKNDDDNKIISVNDTGDHNITKNRYDIHQGKRSLLTSQVIEKLNSEQLKNIRMLLDIGFIELNKCYLLNNDKVILFDRFANADGDWIMNRSETYQCYTGLEYKISRFNFNQINSIA
jgi:hypothetical protein